MLARENKLAWPLLWLSLICCVFEGAVRKWGVGDASIVGRLAYLSKDILLACFLLLGVGQTSRVTNAARPYLVIGLALVLSGAALSCLFGIEPIGAILTIKTFVVLPLAAWCAGRLLPSDSLTRFARWLAILSLPLAFLGIMQFFSSSGSWINRYSTVGEAVTTSGVNERVRATGTFSYISGFTEFAGMAVWAAIVTFTIARTHRQRWLGYVSLIAGFACAFVTVSRSIALICVATLAVWGLTGRQVGRKLQVVLTVGIIVLGALFLTGQWESFDEIVGTVVRRHAVQQSDFIGHRLSYQYLEPLAAFEYGPIGVGLGSQQVATSLADDARRSRTAFESPWGKTIMEVGAVGFLGLFVTWAMIAAALKTSLKVEPNRDLRAVLVLTAFTLLAKAMTGYQFNHVSSYFFWATAAAVLALDNGRQKPAAPIAVLSRDRRVRQLVPPGY